SRQVYIAGETFDVEVSANDPAGEPVGRKLSLALIEVTDAGGEVGEKQISEQEIATDEKTGETRATIKVAEAGEYVLRVLGTDRFGNPVSADHYVEVSGSDDATRLRILADRHLYRAGENAQVQVHWRDQPALALITHQGAQVLGYRLVELKRGMNRLDVPMTEKLAPNFDLTVSVMTDYGAEARLGAHRALNDLVATPFKNTPLKNAVKQLSDKHGIALRLDEDALAAAKISTDSRITLAPSGISLRATLSRVLDPLKLTFVPKGEDLVVTTLDAAERLGGRRFARVAPLPDFHEASSGFEVERPLRITLKPNKKHALPGEEIEVEVSAADPQGKPVAAEISLGLIEKSLRDRFPGAWNPGAMEEIFSGGWRESALRTTASCKFRYAPRTQKIDPTLLAEAVRENIARLERAVRETVEQQEELQANLPALDATAVDEFTFRGIDGQAPDEDQIFTFNIGANGNGVYQEDVTINAPDAVQGWGGGGGSGSGGGRFGLDQNAAPQAVPPAPGQQGEMQLGFSLRRSRGRSQTVQSNGGAVRPEFGRLMELMNGAIEPACCEPQSWETVGGPGSVQPFATNL
ncbi:MAG: hypothetical protein N2C14_25840, partial [Planctomycetales bacterium]